MSEALILVQFLQAAAAAGVAMMPLLERVSSLIQERHMQGRPVSAEDLRQLMDEGDDFERDALANFEKALADPNTPKI